MSHNILTVESVSSSLGSYGILLYLTHLYIHIWIKIHTDIEVDTQIHTQKKTDKPGVRSVASIPFSPAHSRNVFPLPLMKLGSNPSHDYMTCFDNEMSTEMI